MAGFLDDACTIGNSAPLIAFTYRCNSLAAKATGDSGCSASTTISAFGWPFDVMINPPAAEAASDAVEQNSAPARRAATWHNDGIREFKRPLSTPDGGVEDARGTSE